MTTYKEKDKLYSETQCLLDEVAEESRLANITGEQTKEIVGEIYKRYHECLRLAEEEDTDALIRVLRGSIREIMKNPNLIRNE